SSSRSSKSSSSKSSSSHSSSNSSSRSSSSSKSSSSSSSRSSSSSSSSRSSSSSSARPTTSTGIGSACSLHRDHHVASCSASIWERPSALPPNIRVSSVYGKQGSECVRHILVGTTRSHGLGPVEQ